jgi:hypothetical protein
METLEEYAKQCQGNWRYFQSFSWSRQWDLDNPDNYAIVYTSNRDSGLLTQSNAMAIKSILQWFIGHNLILEEYHNHWACGYVEGYAILVYTKTGKITKAFKMWYDIKCQLDDYPVLNEDDYSQREYDACISSIQDELRYHDLDESLACEIYSLLPDNEIENKDDNGAYPSWDSIVECLDDLNIEYEE